VRGRSGSSDHQQHLHVEYFDNDIHQHHVDHDDASSGDHHYF
jgi:hypothetical protein